MILTFSTTNIRPKVYYAFIKLRLDYCLLCGVICPKHQQTTWNCILRMLRNIKHNLNASFKKFTFTELGIRVFKRAAAVHCCACVFDAHQREIIQDILYFDYSAAPTFHTCTHSDGTNKL